MKSFRRSNFVSSDTVRRQNEAFELVRRKSPDETSLGSFLLVGIEWYFEIHGKPHHLTVPDAMRPYWESVRAARLANASEQAKRVLRRRCGWREGQPWPRTAAAEVEDSADSDFAHLQSEILGIYTRSAEVNTILVAYSLDRSFAEVVDAFRAGSSVVAPSVIVRQARRLRSELRVKRQSKRGALRSNPMQRVVDEATSQVAAIADRLRHHGAISGQQQTDAVLSFAKAVGARLKN